MTDVRENDKLSVEERQKNAQISLLFMSIGSAFAIIVIIWGMFIVPSLTPVMIYLLFVVVIGQLIFLNYIKKMMRLVDDDPNNPAKRKALLREVFIQLMVTMIISMIGAIPALWLSGWL